MASIRSISHIPGRSVGFRHVFFYDVLVGTSKVLEMERVSMNRQKSDHLIVALKRVKARGAKGMTSQLKP